jgi:hypothetical protein
VLHSWSLKICSAIISRLGMQFLFSPCPRHASPIDSITGTICCLEKYLHKKIL